jgi:hypothetical protein
MRQIVDRMFGRLPIGLLQSLSEQTGDDRRRE